MKLKSKPSPRWKRLFDVYDEFVKQISAMTSEEAIATGDSWNKYKQQYEEFRSKGVPASALAEGIAQGLRETPESIQRFAPSDRASASAALHRAFELHFPEWLAKEAEAVQKIREKKRVSTDSQFYLIRYQVDLLEGSSRSHPLLAEFQALLDAYEARQFKLYIAAKRKQRS